MNIPLLLGWTWTSINDGAAESERRPAGPTSTLAAASTRVPGTPVAGGERHEVDAGNRVPEPTCVQVLPNSSSAPYTPFRMIKKTM
jgi:hypothetical protein